MSNLAADDLKSTAKLSQIAKQAVEGQTCKLVCYIVEVVNTLGRSTVIDLSAQTENKFRQIDHRSIESIILRNIKYVLKASGAKGEAFTEVVINKGEPKWNYASLAVGNWFSVTNYFKVKAI